MLNSGKRTYWIVFLLIAIGFSCKPDQTPTPHYEPDHGDLKYAIEGVRDTSLEQTGVATLALFVNRKEGRIENINLSISGLPQGIEAYFEPASSSPSYYTALVFKATRANVGDYPLTITGSSQTTGLKHYTMTLKVRPYSNPALALEGSYKESGQCVPKTGAVASHDVSITAVSGVNNKIYIKGIWAGAGTHAVKADIDPIAKTLSIPQQDTNDLSFSGSGTYNDNQLLLIYKVSNLVINDTCSTTLARQ